VALNFPLEGSGSDEKYAGVISFTAINTSTGAQRAAAVSAANLPSGAGRAEITSALAGGTVDSSGGAGNL